MLSRNLSSSAIVVLSLALGITLNLTMFSVVDGLCLRPMPFADPDRVVRIFASTPQQRYGRLSFPDYLDLRAQMQTVSGIATMDRRGASLAREDFVEDLGANVVTRNFFSVLGVKAHVGRFFSDTDEPWLKDTPMVVLSHRLWQRWFGGDPNLVGKPIVLTGRSVTVIGIAPPNFTGLDRVSSATVWYPEETWREERTSRHARWLHVVGRLKPGYTVQQAQTEAETIFRRLDLRDASTGAELKALVLTEAEFSRASAADASLILMGIAGMILLLACSNVSSLLLARGEVRTREIAVRLALGTGRSRLIRQLLTESLLLALMAGAVSLLLARWIISALPAILPQSLGRLALLARLDSRMVIFAVGVSLLTVLLSSLAPSVHVSGINLLPALRGDTIAKAPGRKYSGLNALVVGQMSITLVLVLTASLLTRSLLNCFAADTGFEKKDILLVRVGAPGGEDKGRLFYRQLKERVLALPGVKQASVARVVPFSPSGTGSSKMVFLPEDRASRAQGGQGVKITFNTVDTDFFRLLGIPILLGRNFTEHDDKSRMKVALINDTMAKTFWPDENPIGKHINLDSSTGQPVQIVGVVRDSKRNWIGESPAPHLYLALAQEYSWEAILAAKCAVPPAVLADPVRRELRALGITPSRSDVSTMAGYVRAKFAGQEMITKMLVFFGMLGLGLAGVGLYGVLTFTVNRRARAIGIRMALGAQRADVVRAVVWRAWSLALVGSVLGLPIALAVARILRGALYGVRPIDPASICVSLIVLLGVASLACYLPARRAAGVDPMEALRYE